MKRAIKWAMLAFVLMLGACRQKVVLSPPSPPPLAPTAWLLASPNTLQKGQSTTLTWWTENATDVRIEGVGEVGSDGFWQVTPEDSTTYRLTAKGAGGTQEANARVTVAGPGLPTASKAVQRDGWKFILAILCR